MRQLRQLDDRDVGGEACHLEIGAVDLQQDFGVGSQGAFVIVRMGAVRRADFDDLRAGPGHDVGNPERAADLDQLAT